MDRKIHIDNVFTRYSPPNFKGGIETYIYYLDNYLRDKGLSTRVIAMKDDYDYDASLGDILKIPVKRIPVFVGLLFQKKIRPLFKNSDIVNIHYPTLGVWKIQAPLILTLQTFASDKEEIGKKNSLRKVLRAWYRSSLMKWLEKKTFQQAEQIICVNDELKQELLKRNVDPQKIHVIRNGVDTEKFSYQPPAPKKDDEKLKFLFLGRFIDRKNIIELIHAFARLDAETCKLMVAGVGVLEPRIKDLIENEYPDRDIEFLGYKSGEEVIEAFRTSDVFVLPSFYEGLPFTLLEAMSCGKPAVVGNFANASLVVNEEQNGFIIPQNSIEAMAETLEKALAHRNELKKMSENARRHIEQHFSLQDSLEKTWQVFAGVLEESKSDNG
ncbi:MAG: glycosyltransferase family 4 protein [Bacteroidales bacterium]|nr:glycosyltransferase family 4 protein [Bacteroidales bacterium]